MTALDEAAKRLGVELMPWQKQIGERILANGGIIPAGNHRPIYDSGCVIPGMAEQLGNWRKIAPALDALTHEKREALHAQRAEAQRRSEQ